MLFKMKSKYLLKNFYFSSFALYFDNINEANSIAACCNLFRQIFYHSFSFCSIIICGMAKAKFDRSNTL